MFKRTLSMLMGVAAAVMAANPLTTKFYSADAAALVHNFSLHNSLFDKFSVLLQFCKQYSIFAIFGKLTLKIWNFSNEELALRVHFAQWGCLRSSA